MNARRVPRVEHHGIDWVRHNGAYQSINQSINPSVSQSVSQSLLLFQEQAHNTEIDITD